jgi:di/tricarboxylate transporter
MDEAYEAVSWRTVCLLGGLIPFGRALDHSGALAVLAEGFSFWMGPAAGILPLMLLLLLLATLMSLFVSNVGGMLLLVPLTLSLATQVGHDPRPLLMLVAIGIANAMMVPTNQVTAVIRVPGGYSNKDFFRVGGLTSLWLMVGALLLVGLSS